jgi:hypothetical protein
MGAEAVRQVVCDTPAQNVRVARFVRPDVREPLYDAEAIHDCTLFKELHAAMFAGLPPGGTAILNLGLIDHFPTAFYRLLLRLNEEARGREGRLLFCCLPPNVKEGFDLMGGGRTFRGQVRESESRAVYDAKHPEG